MTTIVTGIGQINNFQRRIQKRERSKLKIGCMLQNIILRCTTSVYALVHLFNNVKMWCFSLCCICFNSVKLCYCDCLKHLINLIKSWITSKQLGRERIGRDVRQREQVGGGLWSKKRKGGGPKGRATQLHSKPQGEK